MIKCVHRGDRLGIAKCVGCGGQHDVFGCALHERCVNHAIGKPLVRWIPDQGEPVENVKPREFMRVCTGCPDRDSKAPIPRAKPVTHTNPHHPEPTFTFQSLLVDLIGTDPFILDIGANDGQFRNEFHTWIKEYGWRGLMIEPVEKYYRKLRANYADSPGIRTVRCAISTEPSVTMKVANWGTRDECGSSTNAAMNRPDLGGDQWGTEDVPGCRLDTMLKQYGIDHVDALCIDTEMMDWIVFEQFPLDTLRPKAIKIEVGLLSEEDRQKVIDKLEWHGYCWRYEQPEKWDIVAADPSLTSGPIDTVIPATAKDAQRLGLLLATWKRFVDLGGNVFVICPPSDLDVIQGIVDRSGVGCQVIDETTLIPNPTGGGWFIQQALKLAASKIVSTPWYLILDCDCFACKPMTDADLLVGSQGLLSIEHGIAFMSKKLPEAQDKLRQERFAKRRLTKASNVQIHPWYKKPAELLSLPASPNRINVTPFLANRGIVRAIEHRLREENPDVGPNVWQWLLSQGGIGPDGCWTEYTLYQTMAEAYGWLDTKHRDGKLSGNEIWYLKDRDTWDAAECFSGEHLFSLVQSNTGTPAAWTKRQIEPFLTR